jgi:hydrogenase maturation protein HypF
MTAVLALGAWLKNAACLRSADGRVRWSPLHGDLGTPAACAALDASAEALAADGVAAVAHDLHPDFHSTRLAVALAGTGSRNR